MDKWEKQHRAELAKIDKRIKAIYEAAAQEAAAIGITIDGLTEELFRFSQFPLTHKRIDKLLQTLHDRLQTAIINGVQSQWTLANNKNNELCRVVFGDNIGKLTKEQYKRYFSNNDAARDAFLARKEAGLGLSDRVWDYTNMFKTEIEMGLDVGIRDGLPADVMARELKTYLQYPDKLFRRVRDEHGQLVLSQAAKAFHPGQGVYRSSFMNARRLAVTETNMAYRTADYERWQQLDFVVGIEVHLSGNHTAKGHKGVFMDICDELQGKYPKDFKFAGWHPFCRCYSTSILKTPAEMERDEARIIQGKGPVSGSEEQVTDVPDGFKQWVLDNDDRIRKARRLPYFLRSNGVRNRDGEYVLKEFDQYKREKTPLDIAKERHDARTSQSVADIQARADARQAVLKDYALTEKRAGNILNMASGWHEVSFVALQTAMDTVANSVVYRKAQMDELKNALKGAIADIKAQQTAEKALADIIPDVHKWHEQFTLAELQEVKNSIPKFKAEKATKYYVNNFDDLPLAKQKQLFEDEIKYVSDPDYHKPHTIKKTWEVAQSIYKKELAIVDEKIAWEATDIKLANIKVYSAANPKSLKIANLIAEAEKIKASGGSIADVEAKILEAEKIKAKNEASVARHAKIAAQKKAKELADLQQKKVGLEQQKKDLESMIALAKPTNAPGLTMMKDDLKAVEKELKAVDKKIDKLGGGSPFMADAYLDVRKKAAIACYDDAAEHAYFTSNADAMWNGIDKDTYDAMRAYTANSGYYTKTARSLPGYLEMVKYYAEKAIKHINLITEHLSKSTFADDIYLLREERAAFTALKAGGIDLLKVRDTILDYEAKARIKYAGKLSSKEIQKKVDDFKSWIEGRIAGKTGTDPSTMSASANLNYYFSGTGGDNKFGKPIVTLKIYCPRGTQMSYVAPYSSLGLHEHEVMIQGHAKFRILSAKYDAKKDKWFVDAEIIGQTPRHAKGIVWDPNNINQIYNYSGPKGGWVIVWE